MIVVASIKTYYEGTEYKLNTQHKFQDESSQLFDIITDKEYSYMFTFQVCLRVKGQDACWFYVYGRIGVNSATILLESVLPVIVFVVQ